MVSILLVPFGVVQLPEPKLHSPRDGGVGHGAYLDYVIVHDPEGTEEEEGDAGHPVFIRIYCTGGKEIFVFSRAGVMGRVMGPKFVIMPRACGGRC